jgi:3-oxoacyl-[acyl-carrier-protein] synthase II
MADSMHARRVVVTGLGCITAGGKTTSETWKGLLSGRSFISKISAFDASQFASRIASEIKDFNPSEYMDPKDAKRNDRSVQLAVCAAKQCLEEIPLDRLDLNAVAVVIGSGIGGIGTFETQHEILCRKGPSKVSPFFIPMMISDMSAGYLSILYGFKGPNFGTVSACASGANAIADAYMLIKLGLADAALTGGTEATITPMTIAGFSSMKALSTRNDDPEHASRPFDLERDGFIVGEGSGMLFLEELEHAQARGADIIAEISGVGLTGDAYHITSPAPNGEGAVRAMRMAIANSDLEPAQVDYINAHGTSTQLNDANETTAIKEVFGNHAYRVKVSSTKSMTGHLLGAAAAVELIFSILAIKHGKIPPTMNQEHPDPACDLDYVPNKMCEQPVNVALSNSFGFGGHNVSIVVKRFDGSQTV